MPLICIHCAMKRLLEGRQDITIEDETILEHMQREHPDLMKTQEERDSMMRSLAERLLNSRWN